MRADFECIERSLVERNSCPLHKIHSDFPPECVSRFRGRRQTPPPASIRRERTPHRRWNVRIYTERGGSFSRLSAGHQKKASSISSNGNRFAYNDRGRDRWWYLERSWPRVRGYAMGSKGWLGGRRGEREVEFAAGDGWQSSRFRNEKSFHSSSHLSSSKKVSLRERDKVSFRRLFLFLEFGQIVGKIEV